MNVIYQEFDGKIKGSITLVNQAKTYSGEIDNNINNIKSSINDIIAKVNEFKTGLEPLEKDVINNTIDYVKFFVI